MNESSADLMPAEDESGDDPFIGKVIADKYEMLELVGGGGTGLVYKARQLLTGKIVAVKVLFPQMAFRADVVNRFRQEARSASVLSHPNICATIDFGDNKSQPYLVMEFIEGISASDWIEQNGKMTLTHAIAVMKQACEGVKHAHKRSVVHRDLKPSNLMITADQQQQELVKIVDFGLAKAFRDENASASKLTKTGEICGSPSYMSPEQCRGIKLDYRTDLFSLGCVFYELVKGHPPFFGEDPIEVILRQIEETPEELVLDNVDPAVQSKLNAVLFTALAKDREKRYQSIEEMSDDISKILIKTEAAWEMPLLKLRVAKLKFAGRADKLPSKKVLAIAVPVAVLISSVIPLAMLLSPGSSKDAWNKNIQWNETEAKASAEKPPERIKLSEFLISRYEEGAGADSQPVINALQERIAYFKRTRQFDQEQGDLTKLLRIRRKVDGPASIPTASAIIQLADCLYEQGKPEQARPGYQNAIPIFEKTFANYADLARPLQRLATIDLNIGNLSQAERDYKKAVMLFRSHNKLDSIDFALASSGLAQVYFKQEQYQLAADMFQQSALQWSKFSGIEKQNAIGCYVRRGDALGKLNQWAEASEAYSAAIDSFNSTGSEGNIEPGESARIAAMYDRLANAQWHCGKIFDAIATRSSAHKVGAKNRQQQAKPQQ